jgi:transcriptional regulator with XRE-family HTH domain
MGWTTITQFTQTVHLIFKLHELRYMESRDRRPCRALLRPSEHGSEIVEKTMAADKATAQQADLPVIEIGTKIRFTRRLRSLTLKEVAAATGCSESLLSKIENGHASPSLKMLQRLTHALGLTAGQLFAQEANPDDIVMRAATRVAFDTELGGRSRVEPLAPHSGGHLLECHLHHFAPGSDSCGDLQHEGEEFLGSNWA